MSGEGVSSRTPMPVSVRPRLDAAAGLQHAGLLHLRDRRRGADDDVRRLAVLEPLAHAGDRAEGEVDRVAAVAA